MAQWIEVKVRYDKMTDSGKTVKVTDPYLVDALTCTEAEARSSKRSRLSSAATGSIRLRSISSPLMKNRV